MKSFSPYYQNSAKQKIFPTASELEIQHIMNQTTTSSAETPSITTVNYQNFNGPHPFPYSTDSELPRASYSSNSQENEAHGCNFEI
jgi:hypothetical protein